jgi:tripartite-type tricarboxylate transporter receptor subunit TctC
MLRKLSVAIFAALSVFSSTLPSQPQNYPSQPIKLVVPVAAGGGSDALGRFFAEALSRRLNQAIVVENRAGAGSTIGANYVATAKPDGYTLLFAPTDSISLAAALRPNLAYKIPEDFVFVARVAASPNIIAVNPKLPIQNLQDMIAYAKANPGKLRYGSSGVGSIPHLACLLLINATGIDMVHVPFGGAGPAMTALLGGFIDVYVGSPLALKPYLEAGNLRGLALTGDKRNRLVPDLPTVAEFGVPDFLVVTWLGLMAPAGTPESVQAPLRNAMADIMKDPDVAERMKSMGLDAFFAASDEFRLFVIQETAQWKGVAEKANIKLD